ncbi:MAG: T9SS type A sorting domain-containing protein, partial [Chlorobi bacterium]|nr:T9SS type A sorting domain-containing protein [Chlorobiota bacterium]
YTGGITTQASTFSGNPENLSASGISFSEIDLSWNLNTESDNVLLAWSSDGTFGTPVDGTAYNSGDVIPGGGTVLSSGNQTSYSHTSLNASTQYFYKVWSNINGTSYSPGVTDNAKTFVAESTLISEINETTDIKIYPNPSNGHFNIVLNNDFTKATVRITDISGKILSEKSDLNKGLNTINLTNVSKGIYFIYINYDNNRIISKLIVN